MSSAPQDIRLCDHCNHTFSRPLRFRGSTTLAQLRTQHVPSSSERETISRLLSETEADLESYDEEINRLEAVLVELRSQRAVVQKYADDCRCLQAPIRRLSVEVLGQVFAHALPQWPGEEWDPEDDESNRINSMGSKAPLILGSVCAKWRDIAITSKEFWSTIIVDLNAYKGVKDDAGPEKLLGVKEILDVYIHRSGDAPLSVSLLRGFDSSSYPSTMRRAFQAIYSSLAEQSHRWRRARISIYPSDRLSRPFWASIEGKLPELEELQILDIDSVPTAFVVAPKLHTVTLFNYFGDDLDDDPDDDSGDEAAPIPWDQIRTLLFDGQFFDFTTAAEHCSQLVRLEINTVSVNRIQLIEYLHCDSLQHLSLHADHWDGDEESDELINALDEFFGLLTLPSLKSLTIGLPSTYTEPEEYTQNVWPLESFTSFLSRSSCSLDTLSLENIKIKERDLGEMLLWMPTLTTLKIHEIPLQEDQPVPVITDALLQILTHGRIPINTTIKLVPRLRRLELKAAPFFNDQALLNMIESRWLPQSLHSDGSGGVACLEYVAVSFMTRAVEPTCLSRLHALGKQGLTIMLDPGA